MMAENGQFIRGWASLHSVGPLCVCCVLIFPAGALVLHRALEILALEAASLKCPASAVTMTTLAGEKKKPNLVQNASILVFSSFLKPARRTSSAARWKLHLLQHYYYFSLPENVFVRANRWISRWKRINEPEFCILSERGGRASISLRLDQNFDSEGAFLRNNSSITFVSSYLELDNKQRVLQLIRPTMSYVVKEKAPLPVTGGRPLILPPPALLFVCVCPHQWLMSL